MLEEHAFSDPLAFTDGLHALYDLLLVHVHSRSRIIPLMPPRWCRKSLERDLFLQ
jgi:hypothetical protein